MAEPFDSAWLKWAQAILHAQKLRGVVTAFSNNFGPEPLAVTVEYEPKRHGFPVVISEMPPLPVECGLILGDVVHNFRSALDHVAWAMVQRGRTPADTLTPSERRRVAMPLCDHKVALSRKDNRGWVKTHRRYLPGVRRADLALVRAIQPYVYGKRHVADHQFAILSELDNLDKHREIQPIFTWPVGGSIKVGNPYHCEVRQVDQIITAGGEMKVGAELCCVRVLKTGDDPKLAVRPEVIVELAVSERAYMWPWIATVRDDIGAFLARLCDLPPEVRDLGLTTTAI